MPEALTTTEYLMVSPGSNRPSLSTSVLRAALLVAVAVGAKSGADSPAFRKRRRLNRRGACRASRPGRLTTGGAVGRVRSAALSGARDVEASGRTTRKHAKMAPARRIRMNRLVIRKR